MKNWFGEEAHSSDCLIHWTEVKSPGVRGYQDFAKKLKEIREAWDVIHADPKTAKAFEVLRSAHYDVVSSDAADAAAGEDI
jgi:hypothetical protein